MKTEIIEIAKVSDKLEFPFLAKHINTEAIFLLLDCSNAVVVHGAGSYELGFVLESGLTTLDKCRWEVLPKGTKVILEQE